MRILKKATSKEDGRALIYYHFPETASISQREAFEDVSAEVSAVQVGACSEEPIHNQATDDALV